MKSLSTLFATQQYDAANFFLIAGPCVVESREMVDDIANNVSSLCKKLAIPYIFKASYRKANRTSADSFTGIGDVAAMEMIRDVSRRLSVPVTTDIHTAEEAALAAKYVDIL